jgi:hypothetical protein
MASKDNKCGCGHHTAIPILIILAALLFLLEAQGHIPEVIVQTVWPILLGLGGLLKLGHHECDCC